MSNDDFDSHVDDMLNVLKDNSEKKVDKNQLKKELKKFIDYGVPVDQAKQTIIKKFGGNIQTTMQSSSGGRKQVADIEPNMGNVDLVGKVISINPKEVTVKGETRKIHYGILGDETGTISFTAWRDVNMDKGDVVEISNAYTREWRGDPQLNLGDRVTVKKADPDSLPDEVFKPKECNVDELKSGMGKVEITARVVDINEREIEVEGEKKKVFSGIIGDETGKSQFTSWHDFGIKEGDVLKISGGYVKNWRGIPQLTFDERAEVEKLKKDKIPKDKIKTVSLPLHRLVEKGGAIDVQVEGTGIEIQRGSGFIYRCPECNRVLRDGECNIHGEVDGKPDLRVKLVVDDGTGAVNALLNRESTEKILGKTLEECKEMDEQNLQDLIEETFFAKRVKLEGNAFGDSYGTRFIPEDVEMVKVEVEDEAERLLEKIGDIL